MEFRQIRYALSVAKQRSFTKAASRLNISQSAVSEQVRLLEEEVGFPLFARTPRGIELTDRLFKPAKLTRRPNEATKVGTAILEKSFYDFGADKTARSSYQDAIARGGNVMRIQWLEPTCFLPSAVWAPTASRVNGWG